MTNEDYDGQTADLGADAMAGQLRARPIITGAIPAAGLSALRLEDRRDGLIYIPESRNEKGPHAVTVVLHSAGGGAAQAIDLLRRPAEQLKIILVAPESRRSTWDIILGGYGPDVAFIDRVLAYVFARLDVDPARLAVGGFSEGASYALSLGLINGDLFSHVIAFSPGFMQPTKCHGTPRVFVSHGVYDTVLPIGSCSRRLVPALQRGGCKVRYEEFGGAHEVPDEIGRESLEWLVGEPAPR